MFFTLKFNVHLTFTWTYQNIKSLYLQLNFSDNQFHRINYYKINFSHHKTKHTQHLWSTDTWYDMDMDMDTDTWKLIIILESDLTPCKRNCRCQCVWRMSDTRTHLIRRVTVLHSITLTHELKDLYKILYELKPIDFFRW